MPTSKDKNPVTPITAIKLDFAAGSEQYDNPVTYLNAYLSDCYYLDVETLFQEDGKLVDEPIERLYEVLAINIHDAIYEKSDPENKNMIKDKLQKYMKLSINYKGKGNTIRRNFQQILTKYRK